MKREGSPTEYVMNCWIKRDGDEATLQCLFSVLKECHHGGLISTIKNNLGKVFEEKQEVVDEMLAKMQLSLSRVVQGGFAHYATCHMRLSF